MIEPALALVEFSSIAAGMQAADAMVKRAPIDVIKAGMVHNGKYLVLIGGLTADVEESLAGGRPGGGGGGLVGPCVFRPPPAGPPGGGGGAGGRARPAGQRCPGRDRDDDGGRRHS